MLSITNVNEFSYVVRCFVEEICTIDLGSLNSKLPEIDEVDGGWYAEVGTSKTDNMTVQIWYDNSIEISQLWFGVSGPNSSLLKLEKEISEYEACGYGIYGRVKRNEYEEKATEANIVLSDRHTKELCYLGRYESSFGATTEKSLVVEAASFIGQLFEIIEARGEPQTIREQKIKARIGQAKFRLQLFEIWNWSCAVTCCTTRALLRASHIQPWHEAETERWNPDNGLLLTANLDALFDRYLISFEDDGSIKISNRLSKDERNFLNLEGMKLQNVFSEQKKHLEIHRKCLEKLDAI